MGVEESSSLPPVSRGDGDLPLSFFFFFRTCEFRGRESAPSGECAEKWGQRISLNSTRSLVFYDRDRVTA